MMGTSATNEYAALYYLLGGAVLVFLVPVIFVVYKRIVKPKRAAHHHHHHHQKQFKNPSFYTGKPIDVEYLADHQISDAPMYKAAQEDEEQKLLRNRPHFFSTSLKPSPSFPCASSLSLPSSPSEALLTAGAASIGRGSPPALSTVSISFAYIIGCYYTPDMDFDDILLDLSQAINAAPQGIPIIIGGDFNLNPQSTGFGQLVTFLRSHDLSTISDTSIPTFFGPKSASRLDYIFCSRSIASPEEFVMSPTASDHSSLVLKCKLPKFRRAPCSAVPSKVTIDFDRCVRLLESVGDVSSDILPQVIDDIFARSTTSKRPRKSPGRKHWFDALAFDLRKKCQTLHILSKRDPSFLQEFHLTRTAYHRHLRFLKKEDSIKKVSNLIDDAKSPNTSDKHICLLFSPQEKRSALSYQTTERLFGNVT
ncbi:unnamed protein product, partial [Cyprideis torosa]